MAIPLDLTAVMAVSLITLRLMSEQWRLRRRTAMIVMPERRVNTQGRQLSRAAPLQLPSPRRHIPDLEVRQLDPDDTVPMVFIDHPAFKSQI